MGLVYAVVGGQGRGKKKGLGGTKLNYCSIEVISMLYYVHFILENALI